MLQSKRCNLWQKVLNSHTRQQTSSANDHYKSMQISVYLFSIFISPTVVQHRCESVGLSVAGLRPEINAHIGRSLIPDSDEMQNSGKNDIELL